MTKRKLTQAEINSILEVIPENPLIPQEISSNVNSILKSDLRKQLERQLVIPSIIPKLKEEIKKYYLSSKIQYGESVGHLSSMSLGEKQTQSNLNYFHKAGSGDKKVSTTSRFADLLSATNKLKNQCFYIYLNQPGNQLSDIRKTIGHSLIEISMKKITKAFSIHENKEPEPWYPAYFSLWESEFSSPPYPHCISYTIDMAILFEYNLTLKEICDSLGSRHSDIFCIPSPDFQAQIDVYADTSNIDLPERIAFVSEENKIEIYFEEIVQPILETTIITGIPGVKGMFFLKEEGGNPGNIQWYIETENYTEKNPIKKKFKKVKTKSLDSIKRYKHVLALPYVDKTRTISNNIWDIYHTLGIEAVRQYMIDQFLETMNGINVCHISLLVDKMTFTGNICSVSRYSMKHEGGVLQKSSFEETLTHFMNAGMYGEHDPILGISAAIICGKRVYAGSGLCDLEMDLEKMRNCGEVEKMEKIEEIEVSSESEEE